MFMIMGNNQATLYQTTSYPRPRTSSPRSNIPSLPPDISPHRNRAGQPSRVAPWICLDNPAWQADISTAPTGCTTSPFSVPRVCSRAKLNTVEMLNWASRARASLTRGNPNGWPWGGRGRDHQGDAVSVLTLRPDGKGRSWMRPGIECGRWGGEKSESWVHLHIRWM